MVVDLKRERRIEGEKAVEGIKRGGMTRKNRLSKERG